MNFAENIRIGYHGLLTHKLRSILTALGIIFGVAAVVAMLSIGEGARQEALEQIRLMGVNNIIIHSKEPTPQSLENAKANFSPGLTALDVKALQEICPFIDAVIPQWEKATSAQYLSIRKDIKVIGTTPEFLAAYGYRISSGRFIQSFHLLAQENVCVIGSDVKAQIFQYNDPIEKKIKIDDQWFSVIGVMEPQLTPSKKVENLNARNVNMDVYLPLTTAQYKLERQKGSQGGVFTFFGGGIRVSSGEAGSVPKEQLDQLTIKIKDGTDIDEATAIIRRIMMRRHYKVEDYELIVPEALVRQSQETQRIFNIVMGAIAGISLLVGGIGIMNIMLASVMERTKEIGIRRAIGATRVDVLSQFLFEAVFLSIVGGLIGVAMGFGITYLITLYAEWRTVVSIPAIILAFTVSAAIGIAFGYYPARKAAYQDPIESLRYE